MAVSREEMLAHVRAALTARLQGRERAAPPPALASASPRGCFVSLKTRAGRLRGCIGTLAPSRDNLADELAENALAAAFKDPRFQPLEPHELGGLHISVDLLSPPEPVDTPDQLDPRRFGVIVRRGSQCGVLLPDLPGVDHPEQQIAICREKAGIPEQAPVSLERFTVERFGD